MNEITVTLFGLLAFFSLLFLIGSIYLENKLFALIFSLISTIGWITMGMEILNGKVGSYYVTNNIIAFQPIQSVTIHYFCYLLGVVSFFITIYILYDIYTSILTTKNKSALGDMTGGF